MGVEKLEVEPNDVLLISLDQQSELRPLPTDGKGVLVAAALRDVKWISKNPAVAKVNEVGVVTPVGTGETDISASVGKVSGSAHVRVAIPAKIEVSPTSIEMFLNETKDLQAKVFDGSGKEIETHAIAWSTKDDAVALANSGKIKPTGAGTTKIFAKIGEASAEAEVTVKYPIANRIELEVTEAELASGTRAPLPFLGYDKEDKPLAVIQVQFESTKPSVATIDDDGTIHALKKGKTQIIAKSGEASAALDLTVTR